MKLLITPKPEKDEGFISYLLRLTEANGYDTPSWILSLSGIDYMELQWKFTFVFSCSEGFKKFAKLTGNGLSDLIALLYLPVPSSKNTTGEADYDYPGVGYHRSISSPIGLLLHIASFLAVRMPALMTVSDDDVGARLVIERPATHALDQP